MNGNQFGTPKTQSATTLGDVSFTIDTPGYYYLSFSLVITKIDAKTLYPLRLYFVFNDDICPPANFYDPKS